MSVCVIKGDGDNREHCYRGFVLAVFNYATRVTFFSDEASDSAFSISEMSVQPNNFVLGEGESKQIILINSGSPLALRCAPGKVGVLEAVFGDEILRQRLKK